MKAQHSIWLRPLLAMLPPVAAFILQWIFWSAIQPYVWFLFYPAVFLSSWIGGLVPGLLSTFVSAALVWWFFIPPQFSFQLQTPMSFVSIVMFSIMGVLFSIFNGRLRNANKHAAKVNATLRASKAALAQFKSTLDQTLDCVFMFHPETLRFIYVNEGAKRQVGYSEAELMRMTPLDIKPEFTEERYREMLKALLDGRLSSHIFETIHRHKDGHDVQVEIALQLVRQEGLEPRFIAFARDITERKHAAELLQQAKDKAEFANRAKDSFLATMSHEIRTPLSGMLGMLELLSLTPLNSEQKKTLQAARDSGKSLLRILSDILDWSKIEAGKLGLSPQATSVNQLLKEVVNTYSRVASAKKLVLWQHSDERLSPAHLVDPLRLAQVLNNFVSNALKFTHQGEVEVRAELLEKSEGAERVRFSVKDTGIGLDQVQQSQLFQHYTQATVNTARMYGGTGLGLAISRRLAELMEGRIELESAPGQGSTFSITLTMPVTEMMVPEQSSAGGLEAPVVQPLVPAGADAPTLLVVDDHPINLALLVRQIELLGLHAEGAEDGEAALKLWREKQFALVITDCHMPKMDGYELAAAIRRTEAERALPRMPVIACTANALSEENERCRAAGMDEVMVKPANLPGLRALLLRWLPALSGSAAAMPQHEAAGVPVDFAELRNIVPERAGQIELLRKFQTHQNLDLDKLAAEFGRADMAATASIAHRIKGASRMVGATELAGVYAAIEQAAKLNDLEGARAAMQTLNAAVNRFETYLSGLADVQANPAEATEVRMHQGENR